MEKPACLFQEICKQYTINKARALHKYSFLKLQNNEKNKIDPIQMPLHRKRKKEKETKWGGVGDFSKKI